jgi:thiol-disulfide isomerase/thioredoxin
MGFLAFQIAIDSFSTIANPVSYKHKMAGHYEQIFKSLTLRDINKNDIIAKRINAPVVILNFWASWCQPCLRELPSMVALQKKFTSSELMIIGINSDEEEQLKNINKTIKEFKINFPIVGDKDSKFLDLFLVNKIPVTIIFNRGRVVEVSDGPMDFESIEFQEKLSRWIKKP